VLGLLQLAGGTYLQFEMRSAKVICMSVSLDTLTHGV
jgi:hypothetical protein